MLCNKNCWAMVWSALMLSDLFLMSCGVWSFTNFTSFCNERLRSNSSGHYVWIKNLNGCESSSLGLGSTSSAIMNQVASKASSRPCQLPSSSLRAQLAWSRPVVVTRGWCRDDAGSCTLSPYCPFPLIPGRVSTKARIPKNQALAIRSLHLLLRWNCVFYSWKLER
jgi:hypothetical protein